MVLVKHFRKVVYYSFFLILKKEALTQNHIFRVNEIMIFTQNGMYFDCIDYSILLDKLNCIGVRGLSLDLIQFYLKNRKRQVEMHYLIKLKSLEAYPKGLFWVLFCFLLTSTTYHRPLPHIILFSAQTTRH